MGCYNPIQGKKSMCITISSVIYEKKMKGVIYEKNMKGSQNTEIMVAKPKVVDRQAGTT